MPWSEASPMDQRTQFISDYLKKSAPVTELCQRYGISRKTAYKWIERYHDKGPAGLEDRSRKPDSHPNQTSSEVQQALLEVRQRHPSWGARKLLRKVEERHPDWELPHPSTVCDLLNRHGLIPRQRTKRRVGHPGRPTTALSAPNAAWSADFKGHFRLGNGQYCYPLTITDNYSRYLFECRALTDVTVERAKPIFTRVFQEYGLPDRIRTDNGGPFASQSLGRLSRLSAWWVRLGILPELIEPGRPQQNGRHERMHRTLKYEATRPPAYGFRGQQQKFDFFRNEYNTERPHEALDMLTPSVVYQPSRKEMPSKLPRLEYPDRFEERYVSANGGIRWNGEWVAVSIVCAEDYVGLEEVGDGLWDVYYGILKLGRLHERHLKIEDEFGRLVRK